MFKILKIVYNDEDNHELAIPLNYENLNDVVFYLNDDSFKIHTIQRSSDQQIFKLNDLLTFGRIERFEITVDGLFTKMKDKEVFIALEEMKLESNFKIFWNEMLHQQILYQYPIINNIQYNGFQIQPPIAPPANYNPQW